MRISQIAVFLLIITVGAVIFFYKRSNPQQQLVNAIYGVMDQYRIPYDLDAYSVGKLDDAKPVPISGIEKYKEQIARYVDKGEMIQILLVGFPFKSANTQQKVFGYLPDVAERKSLQYLQSMLDQIKAIYEPGARITIFCDGVPFAAFLGIPIEHVIAYEQALGQLSTDLPGIQLFTSADFIKQHNLADREDINTFVDQYLPTDDQFKAMGPLSDVLLQRIAIELDHPTGKKLLARQPLEAIVFKLAAREARMRNYILEQFPTSKYIRFTVHFSPDISKKFGVRLSPHSAVTPYHGVCVEWADGSWAIEFKKDVSSDCREDYVVVNGLRCPFYRCDG